MAVAKKPEHFYINMETNNNITLELDKEQKVQLKFIHRLLMI